MTSQISTSTSLIDTTFPISGVDNSTQGFRDNWSRINDTFIIAANEITDLQHHAFIGTITSLTVDGPTILTTATINNVTIVDPINTLSINTATINKLSGTTATFNTVVATSASIGTISGLNVLTGVGTLAATNASFNTVSSNDASFNAVSSNDATISNVTVTNATITNATIGGVNITDTIITNATITNAIVTNTLNVLNLDVAATMNTLSINTATIGYVNAVTNITTPEINSPTGNRLFINGGQGVVMQSLFRVFTVSSATQATLIPSGGELIYNVDVNKLRVFAGGVWVNLN